MAKRTSAIHHPLFARFYVSLGKVEPPEMLGYRRELVDGLAGRVIEVGCGDGRNFGGYPGAVTEVVAVEPEPLLRARAEQAAAAAPVPVHVVDGLADKLPAEDGAFDAAIASLVLCSVPDQATALAEIRRVLRPGGELRFYEHVRARTPRLARVQRAVDRWFWPRVNGGCHTSRDTGAAITSAGFTIERTRDVELKPGGITLPFTPQIVGIARRD
jgi:SAM-dependent methyltransferase